MDKIASFLVELDKLKNITRKTYLNDLERFENSAEHSWHLAMAILVFGQEMKPDLDLLHAIKIALVHDIGEIGAGDVSVYSNSHEIQAGREEQYLKSLVSGEVPFSGEIYTLWQEYQSQDSEESKWVKVFDRFLPFLSNLNTDGRSWKDQGISTRQVKEINQVIKSEAPDIYSWMKEKISLAAARGWLKD